MYSCTWGQSDSGLGAMTPAASAAVQQGATAGAQLAMRGASTQNIVLTAPAIAGASLSAASAMGAGWATAAIPIVGPIIAGVTVGLSLLFARKGPKQKVATTQIVNSVEPLLAENLRGYMAGPRTASAQAQALANFDAGWSYVVEYCQIPEMGNPGKACVADRQRGGQWDWFGYYRDPIANDTQVKPDPVIPDDVAASIGLDTTGGFYSSTVAGFPVPLLLVGAVAAFFLLKGDR